ncbi:hypothetical protein, partial [Escherichia coli]|uniref:hypothetical protein n=1 Tax=Escherichia coli TaxID=562 RepID=UPI00135E50E5
YLTAILRVYNLAGRRDNIHKARIKILLQTIGVEAFRAEVEDTFAALPKDDLNPPEAELARIRAYFHGPVLPAQPAKSAAFDQANLTNP